MNGRMNALLDEVLICSSLRGDKSKRFSSPRPHHHVNFGGRTRLDDGLVRAHESLSRYNSRLFQQRFLCPSTKPYRGRTLPHLTLSNVLEVTAGNCIAWDDFCRFLQGKVVWITPEVYFCIEDYFAAGFRFPCILSLGPDFPLRSRLGVHIVPDTPAAAATETCDFLARLLATCQQDDRSIEGYSFEEPPPLSGAALSLFFQESRSCLRKVTFKNMALTEDVCRALATMMARLDVELNVRNCRLSDDVSGAFTECLHSDRGPVELISCGIDSQTLANALAGESRVTSVTRIEPARNSPYSADMAVWFTALANNRGLVDSNLQSCPITNENWSVLCESLHAHPTLTSLNLIDTSPRNPEGGKTVLADDQKEVRARALADRMQHDTVLHTNELSSNERDQQIYADMIQPYLETNQ
jgi:hypothetical protein